MGTTFIPTRQEVDQALNTRRTLATGPGAPQFLMRRGAREVPLPESIARLVQEALYEVSEGHSIEINVIDDEVSTQVAADLLNVSRPYLIKLLEMGEMAFRMVGSHRRIRRDSVLSYRERQERVSQNALTELARLSQEMNLE